MDNHPAAKIGRLARWKAAARRLEGEITALAIATRDPRVPLPAKLLIAGLVAYALSPIDLIPDFIPVLGYLDDLLLLPLGITLVLRFIPPAVLAEARAKAAASTNKPRSISGACIVILLWLAALWLAYRLLRR